ncbi:MAG: MmgE/PrpD family protein [Burkholderiaceae bacterium]|nr:MmgE/PrpD family protein [Burkholderiaceae bacterium]MDO9090135.1 MmgE/PrpD family protein [Burkholderiaceae bacterium]
MSTKPHSSEVPRVTEILSRYIVNSKPADVPEPVKREALRSFLNWMGCAVGGSQHETIDRALATLTEFAGKPTSTLIGRSERIDALNAALLNGMASHVFDFDDTHLNTIIHPAGPVAPAILALAQRQPISGADLLHAFIIGVEVECRIGNAVYPAHYDIGWHITGTAGVFGAAAAAGWLLKLDERQMRWALGTAGTQSSGMREMFGTMCKSFHPGRAAQNGLMSALLAARNFTSSERVLEAPRGFAHVMSTARDFSRITDGLGASYEIALNTYKPFACGIVIHPAIDGCVQLRNEHALKGDDIESIELSVHPLVLELTGKKTPRTGLEGKFSVYHSCAAAILWGAAGESEYSDACVQNPVAVALSQRVVANAVAGIREDEVRISLRTRDGRTLTKHVAHAKGSLERPMSDAELEEKFRRLCDGVLPPQQTEALIQKCWGLADLADAADVIRAAAKS